MASLDELNSAARLKETIIQIATETFNELNPAPRHATVMSVDPSAGKVGVTYPDEAGVYIVKCEVIMPTVGSVVRVAGKMGSRYVDFILSGNTSATPAGVVWATVSSVAPTGWAIVAGQTITNAQTLNPDLWAACPISWRSGSNLVFPDFRGRGIICAGTGAGLTARTLGSIGGAETHILTPGETGVKGHGHGNSAGPSNNTTTGPSSNSTSTADTNHWHALGGHQHYTDWVTNSEDNQHHHWGYNNNYFIGFNGTSSATVAVGASYANSPTTHWEAQTHGHSGGDWSGGPSANSNWQSDNHANWQHSHDLQNHTHAMQSHLHACTAIADGANGSAHNNMQPWVALNLMIKL